MSVADGLGESWTARVDGPARCWLSRPGRAHCGSSARAAPSRRWRHPRSRSSGQGLPWLAATTRDGRVLAGRRATAGWSCDGSAASAPTASPAIALSRTGRPPCWPRTSPTGTLTARRLTLHGRLEPSRRGSAGRARGPRTPRPCSAADGSRSDAARRGGPRRRRRTPLPLESGRLVRLPGAPGSVTSTPALTATGDGTTYVHQVDARGRLLRPHPDRSALEPTGGDRRRLVALRLPRRRRCWPDGCTSPPSTGRRPCSSRAAVPGERSRMPGRRGSARATRPARPGW